MDRQHYVENRLGAALYRVACLKQQMADARSSPRLLSKLVLELERLTTDLEYASHELAEAREAALGARGLAEVAEARARTFFEMCPLACLTVAQDGTIIEANAAASTLLNVSSRHLCGKPLHLFVNGQRAEFMSHFMSVMTDRPNRWSGRLQPRERSVVPVEVVGAVQPDGHRILIFSQSADARPRARDGESASRPLGRGIAEDALELRHS